MARATLLLPAADRFGGQRLQDAEARALGRADRLPSAEAGRRAQLRRHFRLLPDHWPMAALTRQADAGDAAGACWMRADPAYVRPDINGARLLACGDALSVSREDADALLAPLRPLFGDTGFPIDAPVPGRWYLRMPVDARPPAFAEPAQALGTDLFEHLVAGADGRRWRALANEAQVILHNHPRNADRIAHGLPPVNALWFWGGGVLPDAVECPHTQACSDAEDARALAIAAGVAAALPVEFPLVDGDVLHDLQGLRDLEALQRDWLSPALAALRAGALETLAFDLADGARFVLRRGQRWRFWRRPRPAFGEC